MWDFFTKLWDFITMIWDFVVSLIENLITFMGMLLELPFTIAQITAYTPYIISLAVTSVFSIAVIKVIINR